VDDSKGRTPYHRLPLKQSVGPALGGFLVNQSFMWIFIGDAVTSAITAVIFFIKVPETKPTNKVEDTDIAAKPETIGTSMGGYKDVFRDWKFLFFIGISMIMTLVYMNMNFTLPVFLRDDLSFSPQIYGWLISMNAFMVVIFQFYITRKMKKFPALVVIAIGNLLYGIGFAMYGFISTVAFAFIAMIIITIGEMIIAPFAQAIAANFAPEDKRGRYMAVFGWSGLVPMMFGFIAFGAIMDNFNSIWVWYLCGALSLIAVGGYLLLNKITKGRFTEEPKTDMNVSDDSEILSEIGAEKVTLENTFKAELSQ